MKRFYGLVLALSFCLGCQPPETKPAGKADGQDAAAKPSEKKYRIAVIPKGTTHEFWKSVHYGAQEAGKKYGAEIIWQGPLQESDREGQINVVQNFITQKVDGIVLAPLDSQALVAPCKQAQDKGIPVVIFDSGLDQPEITVSYVATDNRHGGQLAAQEMAKRLGDKGKVVLMRYTSGSDSTHQREEGFLEEIKKHEGITVLSSDQYAGTTPESSLDMAQRLFSKYQYEVNGFFAVCEPNANGALVALDQSKLENVALIGFDPNERMVQALADGKMQGIVLQDPVGMGYKAVETLMQHLEGKKVEKMVGTGEAIATPENMKEPRIHELLHPKQAQ